MSQKKLLIVILIAAVGGGLWLRNYLSPEAAAKRELASMVSSFEQESLLRTMSSISRSYSDPFGLNYEILGGYLNEAMETYEDLDVDLIITGVEVGEERVVIGVRFILWGSSDGSRGYVLGSLSDPCTADLEWRKETPGWRFASTLDLDIPELQDQLERRRTR